MATATLARPAGHPFYERLNVLLDKCSFDEFVEDVCRRFYAENMGRPGLSPGIYFRLLLLGYFEGIDSERGIAWRAADSLSIRAFLRSQFRGNSAGSNDDLADAAVDRRGDASVGVRVGSDGAGGTRLTAW